MSESVVPTHVAIIMDGNRRWARDHGMLALAGHKKVTEHVLEPLVAHAAERGISYLTFWAFSTENWRRDPLEVKGIMHIFRNAIHTFGRKMHEKGIRIRMIGDISKFDPDIRASITELIDRTKNNTRITVVFALNYGGRDEILRAIKKAISHRLSAINRNEHSIQSDLSEDLSLTADDFAEYLDTAGMPDPDMIVRTGGEQRLSGFLPWQSVYSEFYFPQWYMPEFTPEKLDEVIAEYQSRMRRFGK